MRILFILFMLTSCGEKEPASPKTVETIVEVDKIIEVEVEIEKVIEKSQLFEGYYHLENGGIIELVANHRGDVTVESTGQQVMSINPQDSTITEHPRVVGSDVQIISNKLQWSRNENYTSGHGMKQDVSGADIIGIKKTDYIMELNENDELIITIKIWNDKIGNTISNVIASRIIKQES